MDTAAIAEDRLGVDLYQPPLRVEVLQDLRCVRIGLLIAEG
jgi:hypothetical protein